jgi:hypothetical protein
MAAVWLTASAVQGLLTCAERSLESFAHGRLLIGSLYLLPAAGLFCALVQGVCLAVWFCQAVIK